MSRKGFEYYAYQIDLEEYFSSLELTQRPRKIQSTSKAKRTMNLLKKYSNEDAV